MNPFGSYLQISLILLFMPAQFKLVYLQLQINKKILTASLDHHHYGSLSKIQCHLASYQLASLEKCKIRKYHMRTHAVINPIKTMNE